MDELTVEDIQLLVSAGKLTPDMFPKLPKGPLQDAAIRAHAEQRLNSLLVVPGGVKAVTSMAQAAGPVVQGILGHTGAIGQAIVPPMMQAGFSAAGHPWIGMAAAHALGRGMSGRHSAPPKSAAPEPPAQMTGTKFAGTGVSSGTSNGFSTRPTGSAPKGDPPPTDVEAHWPAPSWAGTGTTPFRSMQGGWSGLSSTPAAQPAPAPSSNREGANTLLGSDPWANRAGEAAMLGARPTPPNVTRIDPRPSKYSGLRDQAALPEIAEQAPRGVQNDFRGRVSIQGSGERANARRPEFPPGASNKTPPSIYRQLEEEFAESMGNPAEVEAIRQFIAKALSGGK